LGILKNFLRGSERFGRNNRWRCTGYLNPITFRLEYNSTTLLSGCWVSADFCTRTPIHGVAGVRFIHDHASDGQRVPSFTGESWYIFTIEVSRDSTQPVTETETVKYSLYDNGLVFIYLPMASLLDVTIAIDSSTCPLCYFPSPSSFFFSSSGSFKDFLSLDFADESTRRKDKSADGSIFKTLCDKLKLCPAPLYVIQQNSDVVLVPGEPVHGVGHNHVHRALPEHHPNLFNSRPVQAVPAGRIPDGLHRYPSIASNVLLVSALLGIQ
jgi:hypothetical protein